MFSGQFTHSADGFIQITYSAFAVSYAFLLSVENSCTA